MAKRKKAKVKIKCENPDYLPEFKGDQTYSNCMDLKAYLPKDAKGRDQWVDLYPGEIYAVPTGVYLELPEGYEAQVRARSGLALNHGIGLVNGIGTIDTGYRGEIKVILTNQRHMKQNWSGYAEQNREPYRIKDGDRIAQLAIREVPLVEVEIVEEISSTERGEKGFGSTGKD